ncbi:MAG: hypothetical protein K2I95_04770, partial [Treponemataceae bacterium]|nr:hypothetical protein [Treponemataceae bacterium]
AKKPSSAQVQRGGQQAKDVRNETGTCAGIGGGILISACDDGSDGDGENPVVGGEIVARMTTVDSELTFYENGTVEFKEENATAKSVLARAVTANAATSSGTYSGNVTKDEADITLSFTSGKRTGEGKATIAERDDASNISMNIGGENLKLERIQTLVTAWHTTSGKTVYFYNDDRAMQVIKTGGNTTCHPLVYTGNAGKDGTVQLALLDDNKEHKEYKSAAISGSTMTYAEETYTKIDDDRTLVTAWRALTKENDISFIETMYFYSDNTFMIVMNKKVNDQITNGFAGTYEGVTTQNGTAKAYIAGFEGALPGTITGNKLKIDAPMNITYDRID